MVQRNEPKKCKCNKWTRLLLLAIYYSWLRIYCLKTPHADGRESMNETTPIIAVVGPTKAHTVQSVPVS
jgi:hypothetical protein